MTTHKYIVAVESNLPADELDVYMNYMETLIGAAMALAPPQDAKFAVSHIAAQVVLADNPQDLHDWLYTLAVCAANLAYEVKNDKQQDVAQDSE